MVDDVTRRPFSVRLRPEIRSAAKRAADEDGRTTSAYIERVLEADLRAKGYLLDTPDSK